MNYTDINIEVMLVAFLAIYTLVKRASRTAMMLYVVAFNLYFAYRLNGSVMWLLPATACFNYALTQEMALREGRTRKLLLATVVVADLAVLAYFKYATFILNDVIGLMLRTNLSLGSIVLPVGISFYTFQGISHAVDVYRRRFTMNTTLLEYFFYLTFFPLLLAGPITRAENLIPRLRRNRQASSRMVWSGLWLIMLGLVKKNMVSDYIGQFTTWVFDAPQTFSGFENMAALLGYPVQIYFDFSGYSDMSIGAAAILGFWLPDNFRFPYRALSLTDFWRRWHISLSTWFRDYLYIPLGGNRKGTLRMYANNFITMLVAGLWHGASWMFVIWGALHGFGLCVHKFFSRQLHITIPSTLEDCRRLQLGVSLTLRLRTSSVDSLPYRCHAHLSHPRTHIHTPAAALHNAALARQVPPLHSLCAARHRSGAGGRAAIYLRSLLGREGKPQFSSTRVF